MIRCEWLSNARPLAWLESGPELPDAFAVTHFGDGERPRRREQYEIYGNPKFAEYLVRKEYSGGLFGQKYWIYFSATHGLPARLDVYDYNDSEDYLRYGSTLLRHFDRLEMSFGFAGTWDEYRHRNTVEYDGGSYMHVGQDIRQYMPGMYWTTYIGDSYAETRGVSLESLAGSLPGEIERLTNGVLFTMHEQPDSWREYKEPIDAALESLPPFFSKRRHGLDREFTFADRGMLMRKIRHLR